VAQGDEANTTPAENFTEADLPHHLMGENTPEPNKLAPIRPPAGKKFDDFQLSYAVDLLDGKIGGSALADRHN